MIIKVYCAYIFPSRCGESPQSSFQHKILRKFSNKKIRLNSILDDDQCKILKKKKIKRTFKIREHLLLSCCHWVSKWYFSDFQVIQLLQSVQSVQPVQSVQSSGNPQIKECRLRWPLIGLWGLGEKLHQIYNFYFFYHQIFILYNTNCHICCWLILPRPRPNWKMVEHRLPL